MQSVKQENRDRRHSRLPADPSTARSWFSVWQWLVAIIISVSTVGAVGQEAGDRSTNGKKTPPAFSSELDTVESLAIEKQMEEDLQRISLRTTELFHRHLVASLRSTLPETITIRNGSALARDHRESKGLEGKYEISGGPIQRQDLPLSNALFWTVNAEVAVFKFWISTVRTNSTAAVCNVDKQTLYLNVDAVYGKNPEADAKDAVDEKLEQLGGRTVREVLQIVEEASRKCIKNETAKGKHGGQSSVAPQPGGSLPDFKSLIELIKEGNRK